MNSVESKDPAKAFIFDGWGFVPVSEAAERKKVPASAPAEQMQGVAKQA